MTQYINKTIIPVHTVTVYILLIDAYLLPTCGLYHVHNIVKKNYWANKLYKVPNVKLIWYFDNQIGMIIFYKVIISNLKVRKKNNGIINRIFVSKYLITNISIMWVQLIDHSMYMMRYQKNSLQ